MDQRSGDSVRLTSFSQDNSRQLDFFVLQVARKMPNS